MRLNGYSAVLNVLLFFLFQQAVGAKNCDRPRIANGRAKVRARGKMVYYRCRKKFTRVGAKFAVCLSQGVWSQPPPICIGKGCPNVTPTDGLQIIGEYNGAMLKFTCPAGMKRKGPESIYCNGQTWNVQPPTCVVGISLECDFEDEELCGWGQSDDDHFEWTWLSGATPTVNTGPSHDHTFGNNSKGHYLFIESSAPRKPFDKAILNSPLYQAKYSNSCFEFWYHMQGPDDENAVGSLEVFVKPESKILDDIDPEFYMDGNQGPEWKRGSITIEQQTEVFQIIIIATRKEAFVSDIGLDDVRMYNCSEDDNEFLTTDEVTSEAVPTTITTTTSKIITQKTSIRTPTFKQSTATTTVTKPKTTQPKTKPTKATLPTTTTALPKTTTTVLPTTTTTLPTTVTTMPTTTTLPTTTTSTTTTTLPTTTTTITTKTTRRSTTTPKPKTRKRTTTQGKTTKTRSTTAKTSTKQPETPMTSDSQTTVPSTLSTNTISKSTLMSNGLSNTPTTLKLAMYTTTTISTAKDKPTFTNNSFTGNSQDLPETGSGNIEGVVGGDNNMSSTSNRSLNIPPGSPIKEKTKDGLMPLIIGISCGVVLGLVVIGVAVYLWAKRQQNKTTEESEEEMAPIACAEGGYYNPS
ncbi:mucin-2 isoform X1 [Patella vulgata]|uniref:mucin-2 isoform X1 n=2 Tax=Patella vulgata TaxID=6465 RepID=UPI0021809740|nr:mucin-2 isoform X1 [Patella vulgata]